MGFVCILLCFFLTLQQFKLFGVSDDPLEFFFQLSVLVSQQRNVLRVASPAFATARLDCTHWGAGPLQSVYSSRELTGQKVVGQPSEC